MISYELAKSLEDKGFHVRPIQALIYKTKTNAISCGGSNVICKCGAVCEDIENCQEVEVPTLEDLVEFVDGPSALTDMETRYARKALKALSEEIK